MPIEDFFFFKSAFLCLGFSVCLVRWDVREFNLTMTPSLTGAPTVLLLTSRLRLLHLLSTIRNITDTTIPPARTMNTPAIWSNEILMGVLLALTVESVHSLRRSHHFFLSLSTTPSSRSWGTTSNDRSEQPNFLVFFFVFFIPSWSDHRATFLCLSFLFFSFFSLFFFLFSLSHILYFQMWLTLQLPWVIKA